jgi:hypothetical protein
MDEATRKYTAGTTSLTATAFSPMVASAKRKNSENCFATNAIANPKP